MSWKNNFYQWPQSMYLSDEEAEYNKLQREWKATEFRPKSPSLSRKGPYNHLNGKIPYQNLNGEVPSYTNDNNGYITNPVPPIAQQGNGDTLIPRVRKGFKDPYLKNKAKFEQKPKLPIIIENSEGEKHQIRDDDDGQHTFKKNKKRSWNKRGVVSRHKKDSPPNTVARVMVENVPSVFDSESEKDVSTQTGDSIRIRGHVFEAQNGSAPNTEEELEEYRKERRFRRRKRNKRLWICIGVILVMLVVGILASAVAIYFAVMTLNPGTSPSPTPFSVTSTVSNPAVPVSYVLSMKLKRHFHNNDLSGPKARQLTRAFCGVMEGIIKAGSLKDSFVNCSVVRIRSGSILVESVIVLLLNGNSKSMVTQDLRQNMTRLLSDKTSEITKTFIEKYDPESSSLAIRDISALSVPATSTQRLMTKVLTTTTSVAGTSSTTRTSTSGRAVTSSSAAAVEASASSTTTKITTGGQSTEVTTVSFTTRQLGITSTAGTTTRQVLTGRSQRTSTVRTTEVASHSTRAESETTSVTATTSHKNPISTASQTVRVSVSSLPAQPHMTTSQTSQRTPTLALQTPAQTVSTTSRVSSQTVASTTSMPEKNTSISGNTTNVSQSLTNRTSTPVTTGNTTAGP